MRLTISSLGLVLALTAPGWVSSCSTEKKAADKSPKSADDDATDTEQTDGDAPGDAPAGNGNFDGWCAKASETTASQDLGEYFAKLCNGKKATAFFSSTLVTTAYAGKGNPTLKYIEKISSDKATKTTTAYFGVGIKLPGAIQSYFDTVAPKQGDEDSQKKLAAAQDAQQDSLDITKRTSKDKYWKRGWNVHSSLSQQVGPIKLETETKTHSDQYELDKGSLYMFVTATDEGIKTIKEYSLLTAGLDIDGKGYLITVAFIKVDNKGLDSVAESKLKDTANGVIKAMYQAGAQTN